MRLVMTITKKTPTLLILFILLLAPLRALASNEILNVRHWTAPSHTRVVIDMGEEAPYKVEKAGRHILIHFRDMTLSKSIPRVILLKKPGIEKIMATSLPDNAVAIELFISDKVETNIFNLKRFEDKPDRVVIDILNPEVEKREAQAREQVKVSTKKIIIVIDPGHGGEDPGAVGKYGTYEKHVVLAIGKKLQNILNKKKGYRAFLTRNGDYYVSFKKRLRIAREYGADLFVSIHADAFKRRDAKGSSVYCLSIGGASSEAAKLMARNENLADIIGGSPNGDNSDEVDPIILNMFQTNTINTSKIFGSTVLKHMNSVGHVKFNSVQEAPFRVLKLPEIPSVLIETAYISNPKEERLLRTSRYQTQIANAIARAITEFLPATPVIEPKIVLTKKQSNAAEKEPDEPKAPQEAEKTEDTKETKETKEAEGSSGVSDIGKGEEKRPPDAAEKPEKTKQARVFRYKVVRGDTLGRIASRHGTTIGALLTLNGMKLKDPLYVGRVLKIRELEEGTGVAASRGKSERAARSVEVKPSPTQKISVYAVRKGDTLEKIANRHDTTIAALLTLNRMKLKDPLYVGRILKIREPGEGTGVAAERGKQKRAAKDAGDVQDTTQKTTVYRVKRGDTLEKIARKHNTSVGELRKLNKIKQSDVIFVGQNLKLPRNPS